MAENAGYFIHNPSDAPASAFIVIGQPRGGTTMTAKMLDAAGVLMGKNLPVTFEDPQFVNILKEPHPDRAAFNALVAARHKKGERWGFKAPFRQHWRLLQSVPDCRFVVVYRDALAIANRSNLATGMDLLTKLGNTLTLQKDMASFLQFTNRPAFVFSYEKMVTAPDPILTALASFVGAPGDAVDMIAKAMKGVINLNDRKYQVVGTAEERQP